MMKLSKLRRSRTTISIICIAIMGIMVALNSFTPKCVDDYFYSLSLPDHQILKNIADIFPTLRTHAQIVNGRLVSHFFAYLFNYLPKIVFNLANSAVFLLMIIMMYRLSCKQEQHDAILLLFQFCAVWYFEYAFGQVNIWLTGSCNYLWGIVVSLVYVYPFYNLYVNKKEIRSVYLKILFAVFSLFAGAYNEIASSTMVFVGILFLILTLLNKRKPGFTYYLAIILSCLGYIIMLSAPAEALKVGNSRKFGELLLYALKMYLGFHPLIILWLFLFILLFFRERRHHEVKQFLPCPMIISSIFMLGSLEANFVLTFASSYSDRCASPSLIYLVIALSILLNEFSRVHKETKLSLALMLWIIPFTVYRGVYGTYDIYRTGRDMKKNICTVSEAVNRGEMTVQIPYVYASTKYSPVFDLKYLDAEDPDSWPNYYIAWYFGLDKIIGER